MFRSMESHSCRGAASPRPLVLASSSPRRRDLLANLRLPFSVVSADVPESPLPGETPVQMAERLALTKARAVIRMGAVPPTSLVVGADTVVIYRGRALGKPTTPEEAVAMLRKLRGRAHRVVSAVAVVDPQTDDAMVRATTTRVQMRPMTDEEIARYVASGDPLDKAGAYAIQNRAFHPVDSIAGCYSNVVGLPLCTLAGMLAQFGESVPEGWRAGATNCACTRLAGEAG